MSDVDPIAVLREIGTEIHHERAMDLYEAVRQVEALVEAAHALLEWAEKDRGGGYPEANRSEEWYTHRDYARIALAPFPRKEQA